VGESTWAADAHNFIYSARSSWEDVKHIYPNKLENVKVRLKDGKTITGSTIQASDDRLTLKHLGRTVEASKREIAEVDYIRFKPVSEVHEYVQREGAGLQFLDPKMWQYLLRINAVMPVRIYEASLPEDDSPLPRTCEATREKR
jgi:hypothetical protein